jgi:hypothetical protein
MQIALLNVKENPKNYTSRLNSEARSGNRFTDKIWSNSAMTADGTQLSLRHMICSPSLDDSSC